MGPRADLPPFVEQRVNPSDESVQLVCECSGVEPGEIGAKPVGCRGEDVMSAAPDALQIDKRAEDQP